MILLTKAEICADNRATLRGLAASHAAGQPEVLDDRARRDGVVYNKALTAVGLALAVGDWREETEE